MCSVGEPDTGFPAFFQKLTDSSSSNYRIIGSFSFSAGAIYAGALPGTMCSARLAKQIPPAQHGESLAGYSKSSSTFHFISFLCGSCKAELLSGYLPSPRRKENSLSKKIHARHMKKSLFEVQKCLFRMNSWKTLLKIQCSLCQQKSTWAG